MWLRRLFQGNSEAGPEQSEAADPSINRGVFYLYTIIGVQIALVFGLVIAMMFIGQVIATPLWVFLVVLGAGIWGCVTIYRKAKRQFQKLREAIQKVDLSDRNFEISVMGGFLTMRVEQNPRRLLEAPPRSPRCRPRGRDHRNAPGPVSSSLVRLFHGSTEKFFRLVPDHHRIALPVQIILLRVVQIVV